MAEFSVVVPVLNGERTLGATLVSICGQSLSPKETIVVDNGSTDGTREVVARFPSVKYIFLKKKGRSLARNKGASLAKGQYLVFVDADVVLAPDWLEKSAGYLRQLPLDGLATRVERRPEGKNVVDSYREAISVYQTAGAQVSVVSPAGPIPMINTAACIFSRESFKSIGGFDVNLQRHEDLDLSLKLFSKGYLIGGITSAKAEVRFVPSRTFPKARDLSYLWRAFELQYRTLFPGLNSYKIDWPVLKFLRDHGGSRRVLAFGALMEVAKITGRLCAAGSGPKRNLARPSVYGKKTLAFSFFKSKLLYRLHKTINFIFLDNEVFVMFRRADEKRFRVLNTTESTAIRKLCGNKNLSGAEKGSLLKSGWFTSVKI